MNEDYFKTLTPREQLNDLMHKYAQTTGGNYRAGWQELDRRWKAIYGSALSWLRWKHNQDTKQNLTLPTYLEGTGQLGLAITIATKMKEENKGFNE
ncbi:MAG: hypothetical protein WCO53_15195 [Deltaproteobacteria bacterium]